MRALDPLLRDLGDAAAGTSRAPRDDQTWNVLVQVLLPLVFVLTFVVITGLMVYKAAYEMAQTILEHDGKYSEMEAQERLMEVQLQKLLRALEVVKVERRSELRISLFPHAPRVRRRGVELADADFQLLCRRTSELFEEGAGRARLRFASEIYREVLSRAQVNDPSSLKVQRWGEHVSDGQAAVDGKETMKGEVEIIIGKNRRRVHNAILDFVDGLEEQVVDLQVELLHQVFDELLASGSVDSLDPASNRRLDEILDPSTPETERRRAAGELYRELLQQWRRRFDEAGYPFLDQTWRAVLG